MLEGLDSIPWASLSHADGSAADVPAMLRGWLKEDNSHGDLFVTIWHQGSVYEATSYAVPFLLEMVADRQTPDRESLLSLLAGISEGSSGSKSEGNWGRLAKEAVNNGFDSLVAISEEPNLSLDALNVLSTLRKRSTRVSKIVREFLQKETNALNRAALYLLLGKTMNKSEKNVSVLLQGIESVDDLERGGAVFGIAALQDPLPDTVQKAMVEVLLSRDFERRILEMRWLMPSMVDSRIFADLLSEEALSAVTEGIGELIEAKEADHSQIINLVDFVFPYADRLIAATELSSGHRKILKGLIEHKDYRYGTFNLGSSRGLPHSAWGVMELLNGRDLDLTPPYISYLGKNVSGLTPGAAIFHKSYGPGIFKRFFKPDCDKQVGLVIAFEWDGEVYISVPNEEV